MTPWSHLPPWLALLIDGIACYRLTRLVTKDVITLRAREQLIRWAYLRAGMPADAMDEDELGPGLLQSMVEADMEVGTTSTTNRRVPRLAVLIVCRWCSGAYVGALVVAGRWFAPAVWGPVAWLLVVASAAALLAQLED